MSVRNHENYSDTHKWVPLDTEFLGIVWGDQNLIHLEAMSHSIGRQYGDNTVNRNNEKPIIANIPNPHKG